MFMMSPLESLLFLQGPVVIHVSHNPNRSGEDAGGNECAGSQLLLQGQK